MLRLCVLMVLAGCVSENARSGLGGPFDGCPSNASNVALDVSPVVLARGDAVDLDILWTVDTGLTAPVVATLHAGNGPVVEVELPLELQTGASLYAYHGSLLNPFGAGAPAGTVGVLTSAGVASGCDTTPTAATALTLE